VTLKKDDIRITRFNNKKVGRKVPAMVGNCETCGTFVSKFICEALEAELVEKYGKY
jgi:hypothetical protein